MLVRYLPTGQTYSAWKLKSETRLIIGYVLYNFPGHPGGKRVSADQIQIIIGDDNDPDWGEVEGNIDNQSDLVARLGSGGNLASPGPIGSTTPSTGAFTSLTAATSGSTDTFNAYNTSNGTAVSATSVHGAGVYGVTNDGVSVLAYAFNGIGVQSVSESREAGVFQSNGGTALVVRRSNATAGSRLEAASFQSLLPSATSVTVGTGGYVSFYTAFGTGASSAAAFQIDYFAARLSPQENAVLFQVSDDRTGSTVLRSALRMEAIASETMVTVYGAFKPLSRVLASLPSAATSGVAIAYASNGRKSGESAGNGTGIPVWSDGTNWRTFYDNSVAAS